MATLGKRRNIVIVGETGAGKSSVINMILGKPLATISGSPDACTFHWTKYNHNGDFYFDTVGLNDVQNGTYMNSARQLFMLLKELENSGIHLIIFVMEQGRITATTVNNYKVFIKGICENKVPAILLVTKGETEPEIEKWYLNHQKSFKDNNMDFYDHICGCFTDGADKAPALRPFYIQMYQQTQIKLNAILNSAAYDTSRTYEVKETYISEGTTRTRVIQSSEKKRGWLKTIFFNVWNIVSPMLNWPSVLLPDIFKRLTES